MYALDPQWWEILLSGTLAHFVLRARIPSRQLECSAHTADEETQTSIRDHSMCSKQNRFKAVGRKRKTGLLPTPFEKINLRCGRGADDKSRLVSAQDHLFARNRWLSAKTPAKDSLRAGQTRGVVRAAHARHPRNNARFPRSNSNRQRIWRPEEKGRLRRHRGVKAAFGRRPMPARISAKNRRPNVAGARRTFWASPRGPSVQEAARETRVTRQLYLPSRRRFSERAARFFEDPPSLDIQQAL